MPGLNEEYESQLAGGLDAGLETLSLNQEVTFTQYVRVVLPLDGFVFWVSADLLAPSAVLNAMAYDQVSFNQGPGVAVPAPTLTVKGSLHYATDFRQEMEGSYGLNQVTFTAQDPVQDFNLVSNNIMYIAEVDGIMFSFSRRDSFYKQADLYHYRGDAVLPRMMTQLINKIDGLDISNVICSNSMPIWLSLNKIMPIYPALLTPTNIRPPYATVEIREDDTVAIQSTPSFDSTGTHWQLVSDTVRLTIFGLRNFNALDFQDYVLQSSLDTDLFGIMGMPIIRDAHYNQAELNAIAMAKTITFKINYYQSRMQDVARQLILSAIPTFYVGTSAL